MEEKNVMYNLITPYRCKLCNQDMLFFETRKNTLIDYKQFISSANTLSETIEKLGQRNIKYLKCIRCGRHFIIDWTNGWPEPLLDRSALKQFGI